MMRTRLCEYFPSRHILDVKFTNNKQVYRWRDCLQDVDVSIYEHEGDDEFGIS